MSSRKPIAVLVDSGSLVIDRSSVPPSWDLRTATAVPSGPDIVALAVNPACGPVRRSHLRSLPDLQLLFATSAGTDHLDLDAAAEFGIDVRSNPGYCVEEVADHTLALILGALRRTHMSDRAVRQGKWEFGDVVPRRISGTRLGLWGYGSIGRAVALRARALGMDVAVHSRSAPVEENVRQVDWHELIGESDVLSLHVPLVESTRGAFDASVFDRMRAGSYLVNVSRGELVDESALAHALDSGHLAGASLDVLRDEPPVLPHVLLDGTDAVVTPHIAWMSPDSVARPFARFAELLSHIDVPEVPRIPTAKMGRIR